MKTKEINLCGKQVTLGYCFATEIGYKILSDEDIQDFMSEAISSINENRMPDARKSIYLVLASMQSYYDSKDQKPPLTDKDLMYGASSEELGFAIGTAIGLWMEFNKRPAGEPEDKKADEDTVKNA